ncbi:dynamin family protein-like protein [Tothia fuscella]|uniref:Dynamin family protein-like protein n=1 Tax=Tothia fuscella TaxID=1048955 RepID=A0A9P4NXN0_9PEZI|nr:dynamin family protein-like protein [Tothia fuscella]
MILTPPETDDAPEMKMTDSMKALESSQQSRVLDTVAQIRKCGLEGVLSLPQIVVCGDQSAGKSSVLEALTEIPYPRNDNLCTRYATEIILRRGFVELLTVKVIPDNQRDASDQEKIRKFSATINDFNELPALMNKANEVMGIGAGSSTSRAFSRDVLSITIEGPNRPQLTVVDLPGLIQNKTKDTQESDVKLVDELTESYIGQERTICLAVVAATNDYANQGILTKVQKVDPDGNRSMGIITKPDRLEKGSGTEKAFVELAQNKDVHFKLGWHVLRNRGFDNINSSFLERNANESNYFRTSAFKVLPKTAVGIDALRKRLSDLLFEHVKKELPKLREDLEVALKGAHSQRETLGKSRASVQQCREFMTSLSQGIFEIAKAAIDGRYEEEFFRFKEDEGFEPTSQATIRRLRALVQNLNSLFSDNMDKNGIKYLIEWPDSSKVRQPPTTPAKAPKSDGVLDSGVEKPIRVTYDWALEWVEKRLESSRGRELQGNFNPLIIGELSWAQISEWEELAIIHTEIVAEKCEAFLQDLIETMRDRSLRELESLLDDLKSHPINYNDYYIQTVKKRREDRLEALMLQQVTDVAGQAIDLTQKEQNRDEVLRVVLAKMKSDSKSSDLKAHSCEEVLDCVNAIYKVQLKTFVANVTTQCVERHVVRGLENIFAPLAVAKMSDEDLSEVASEPLSLRSHREFLDDRIAKLEQGHDILKKVMRNAPV